MSIASSSSEDSTDERSIFEELVESSSLVCSNCFRKLRESYEINYTPDWVEFGNELRRRELEEQFRVSRALEDEVPFSVFDHVSDAAPSETRIPIRENTTHYDDLKGRRRICICGVPNPYEKRRPVSKEDAKRMLERLIDLFESETVPGFDLDRDLVWSRFRELKSDPDEQFDDDGMFEEILKTCTSTQPGI